MIPELRNKDKRIEELVTYLFNQNGKDKFQIRDYWESDNCAIGLIDLTGKYLIYVSAIGKGLESDEYYVALENVNKIESDFPYESSGEFNKLNLEEVNNKLKEHLRIE